ncbi:MAG: 4'-phosphopantetheinyl transferase superfamily protein [Nodosilinea sp.]
MPQPGQEPPLALEAPAVDLWLISTETVVPAVLGSLASALSATEQTQLQHLRHFSARQQFILSRGCLRYLLSRYTGQSPSDLVFAYGPRGKPELCPNGPGSALVFNLSHSGTRLLVGVSTATEVSAIGVDIEVLRSINRLPGLCRRCLTPAEAKSVLALDHPQADRRFLRYWTGKEAWLKALGLGIADAVQTLELAIERDMPSTPEAVAVTADRLEPAGELYQGQLEADYFAAIALQFSHRHAVPTFHLRQTTPADLALHPSALQPGSTTS